MAERRHVARRRCGQSEVMDVLAVLSGSALCGERILETFDEHVHPFAQPFMALCGRERWPARSTFSRVVAALTPETVESVRALFLEDLLERRADGEPQPCGLSDRAENHWKVFDSDGTREAASPRALPKKEDQPAAERSSR